LKWQYRQTDAQKTACNCAICYFRSFAKQNGRKRGKKIVFHNVLTDSKEKLTIDFHIAFFTHFRREGICIWKRAKNACTTIAKNWE